MRYENSPEAFRQGVRPLRTPMLDRNQRPSCFLAGSGSDIVEALRMSLRCEAPEELLATIGRPTTSPMIDAQKAAASVKGERVLVRELQP